MNQFLSLHPTEMLSGRRKCKESRRLSGSLPCYIKSATYLTAPLPSSPYRQHTKNTRVTKPSVSNIVRRPNKRAGVHAHGEVGSATGGQ